MHSIYILEITDLWYSVVARRLPEGKRCFYVGETARNPRDRRDEHLSGIPQAAVLDGYDVSGRVFKRMRREAELDRLVNGKDVKFREKMAKPYNTPPIKNKAEAEAQERRAVINLRKRGHAVYPKSVGSDVIPFESYRESG